MGRGAQIFKRIVGLIAVRVIDYVRRLISRMQKPDDPMNEISLLPKAERQISF